MANRKPSPLQIDALCVLAVIILTVVGLQGNEARSEDASSLRLLAEFFRVERLPASAREIQCVESRDPCDPSDYSTMCYVRIEPHDFELLARESHFEMIDNCPENFSYSHVNGLTIGPSFRINEHQMVGNRERLAEIYPDAAHSQFVAVLSWPSRSRLQCLIPAKQGSVVLLGKR